MPTIRIALATFVLVAGTLIAAAPGVAINSFRVTTLLEALDDDSFEVRQKADEELRAMGKGVVAYLREEHLRTSSLEVKGRLSRMIRDLSVHERIPHLVKMLTHKDERFRSHAERTLRNVPVDHLPNLEAELNNRQGEGRRRLERIIADISGR